MKIRYAMMILTLLLLAGVVSAWLPDYDFRKAHHIDGSITGDQVNYQIKFVVHRSSGTDNGAHIYVGDHCEADYRDIRFTLTDDTILDYWIESSDSSSATIWVKVPSIPSTGGVDLFVYYGNPVAISASNGVNTFPMFDTFDGSALNTAIWARWLTSGTTAVSGGKVRVTGGSGSWEAIGTKYQQMYPYAARMLIQCSGEGDQFLIGVDERSDAGGGTSWAHWNYAGSKKYYTRKAGIDETTSRSSTLSNPTITEIRQLNSTHIFFYENDTLVKIHSTQVPNTNMGLSIAMNGNTRYVDCFWAFYRKYIESEPAHSTWNPEEEGSDNIIMPDEMPFTITPELVTEVGQRFYIGGDWTGDADDTFAVNIAAPDVVLDGNHYTLTGTIDSDQQTYQCAVVAGDLRNITVFHVNATGWNQGIAFDHIDSAWIDQNNMYGNYNSSIGISWSNAINIAGNSLRDNGENGVYAGDSTYVNVFSEIETSSEISGNPTGIFFNNVSFGSVERLPGTAEGHIHHNSVGIFAVDSDNIKVADLRIYDNNGLGIGVDNIDGLLIQGNIITNSGNQNIGICNSNDVQINGNGVAGGGSLNSIVVYDSTNVLLNNNVIDASNANGVELARINELTVQSNTMMNNGNRALTIGFSTNVSVFQNQITDHMAPFPDAGNGICITNTVRANTDENILTNNRVGIYYQNTTFNHIFNNSINLGSEEQDGAGVWMADGSGMTGDSRSESEPPYSITRNIIIGYPTGIGLDNVADILIFDNYFNNSGNYFIGGGTSGITWNITKCLVTSESNLESNIIGGEYFGGNYWAQPDGNGWSQVTPDADLDGICDSPYELDLSDNTDLLPLGGFHPVFAHFTAAPSDTHYNGIDPAVVQFTDESTGPIDAWDWNFADGTSSSEQNPSHGYTGFGVYNPTLTVHNVETDETSTWGMFIYIRPETISGIPIWDGWNYISTPRTLADKNDTVEEVFKDVNTGGQPVYYYNADAENPGWEILVEGDKILPLDGIWIYSTQVGPYVSFTYNTEYGGKIPRIKHLEPGWNSIGIGSVYDMATDSYLSTLKGKWSVLLEYDSSLQTYFPPQIEGVQTGGMTPGRGYWIYMDEGGDLLAMTG